jgi:hypothetical protein
MTICVNCGVELDTGFSVCPLCGKDPRTEVPQDNPSLNYPSEIIRLHSKEIRMSLWELTGIIAFSAVVVCTIVDLIITKRLGWSLISDIFVLGGWITFTLFLHAYKRTYVIIPGLLITILAALFTIDLLGKGESWFLPVGLPLTVSVFIAAGIIIMLWRVANLKGLNILAATLLVLSGLCILTEMIVETYLKGYVSLRWSLIASISIFPLALILLFYHYRLKKGNLLDSFFHV